ncbi:MAG: alginate lyase family protein, partial [Prolixibacteraceae bacterium]|nr:alginate lyase family protein [Prolixibacteraceae bacterium]
MKKLSLTIFLAICFAAGMNAQWLWNIHTLQVIRGEIESPTYAQAYAQLLDDAERALSRKPYSVMNKQYIPPGGDKHDYASLSRYTWPDPSKPDGLPYIHKDGQSNPELRNYDRNPLGDMAGAVNTLALAYFYSGDERYAEKAVDFLRVWFLNEDTKMNPNLKYAQFVPGVNDNKGRSFGLIDTYSFVDMLNA